MLLVGNSIKQCSQTVISVFEGSLLVMLVCLPGQTKGAELKAFPFILLTSRVHIKLATIFFLILLACARELQLLIIRSQIFQYKYRNNIQDKPFKEEKYEHGRSRASTTYSVLDLMLHWCEGKIKALGSSRS